MKSWLEQLPVTTEECAGKTYFSLPCQSSVQTVPDCLFLAGFDPMLMGYEKTDNPFLPLEHLRKIFNMAGIVMPAVLLRGRIVGKWKRSGKKLLITLFEPIADPAPIHLTAKILWPAVNICIQN